MAMEELEKLENEIEVTKKKMKAEKDKEKFYQAEIKRLTRSERTHRLCTRGAQLETYLRGPNILTDEDVTELLSFIFQFDIIQKKLDKLLARREEILREKPS